MITLAEMILRENSMFGVVAMTEAAIRNCSVKCRAVIRKGPNAAKEMSLCIAKCKIGALTSAVTSLQGMRNPTADNKILDSKIRYMQIRRLKEIEKQKGHKQGLDQRRTTIPVAQSMKPSKETPLRQQ